MIITDKNYTVKINDWRSRVYVLDPIYICIWSEWALANLTPLVNASNAMVRAISFRAMVISPFIFGAYFYLG